MSKAASFPQIDLTVTGLNCSRGGREVLAGLDFALTSGKALTVRGPNGAGKSTLLLCLAGLIHFEGLCAWDVVRGPEAEWGIHELMHFAGHRHGMKPELTLGENLEFWASMLGGDPGLIEDALRESGLGGLGGFAARNLSAGQTHRLALCRLLVAPRPVWLLDEPTSALDKAGDKWVAGLISRHLGRGGLVVAATHRALALKGEVETLTLEPTA